MNVGGALIKGQQMGLGTNIALNTGIMGVGFSNNVAALTVYPNIIDQMVSQGVITVKAYSLWLVSSRALPWVAGMARLDRR